MIKLRGLSHAGIAISDPDRAKNFYINVLGMRDLPRPAFPFGGAWLQVGDNMVHLIEASEREIEMDPQGPHIALDVEDFDEARRTLQEMGVKFLEPKAMVGRQLFLLDPDGNMVELRSDS